jgi:acid phosphatase
LPSTPLSPAASAGARHRWHPAHVVVVIEENHAYDDIIGSRAAPYMNKLARHGASLLNYHAITHPSEPNYLALFSGSTHGLTGDGCPLTYHATNLAHQLRAAGRSFAGYAEGLPHTGSRTCAHGNYVRRHAPWTDFPDLPGSLGRPLSRFPAHFADLPDVSFVIPDMQHDMHDGTVGQADRWLHNRLGDYVTWARRHDSELVLTWDEDDFGVSNHIPTVIVGSHVRVGHYRTAADHYRLLRTIEWLFGLSGIHRSKGVAPLTQVFS